MNMEPTRTTVTSAEFVRHFGTWQDRAATRPIYVTHHGRERIVLLSINSYEQMLERARQGDRQTLLPDMFRLGAVLERVAEGFIAVDRKLVITEVNPAACSYLRAGRSQMVGTSLHEIFADAQHSLVPAHMMRSAQAGEVSAFDQPSPVFQGRWLHFETLPYLEGAACLFRDVTGEREQRQIAAARAAETAAMKAHGRMGRAHISTRGTFTFVDDSLANMAGFEPEALYRARFTDILPLSRRVAAAHEIESVLAGGEPITFLTALMVNRGGERPVRVAMAELKGEYASEGAVLLVTPEPA